MSLNIWYSRKGERGTNQIALDLADRCGTNIGVDDIDRSPQSW